MARGRITVFEATDWQNADLYLCRQIGSLALYLRDHGHTYPEELEPEAWRAILTQIGEPLLAYAEGKFPRGLADGEGAAKQALLLFADHFTKFWD